MHCVTVDENVYREAAVFALGCLSMGSVWHVWSSDFVNMRYSQESTDPAGVNIRGLLFSFCKYLL